MQFTFAPRLQWLFAVNVIITAVPHHNRAAAVLPGRPVVVEGRRADQRRDRAVGERHDREGGVLGLAPARRKIEKAC